MLKFINFSIKFFIIFSLICLFFALSTLWYFSIGLPDYKKLSNYQPPISSRVYSSDGKLIGVPSLCDVIGGPQQCFDIDGEKKCQTYCNLSSPQNWSIPIDMFLDIM